MDDIEGDSECVNTVTWWNVSEVVLMLMLCCSESVGCVVSVFSLGQRT